MDKTAVPAGSSGSLLADNRKESSPPQGLTTLVSDTGEPNGVAGQASGKILDKAEPVIDSSILAPQASHAEDQMDIPRPSIEVRDFPVSLRRLLINSSLPMTKAIKMVPMISQ